MRELSPFYIPFIPAKRTSSPPKHLVLPPHEIAHLPQENEIFLPPVTLLLKGK